MKDLLRKRLYALQQRLALTGPEAMALLGIASVLALGGVVQQVESRTSPVAAEAYAELDAAVAHGAGKSIEEALAALPPDSGSAAIPAVDDRRAAAAVRPASRGGLPPVRMDPNTASAQYLQRLPGIGPALAERIVEYRESVGPFRTPRDLMRVRGIGPKTFERLEPYLHVAPPRAVTADAATDQTRPATSVSGSESDAAPSPP
jgi:competence protein ComEA